MDQLFALGNVSNRKAILEIAPCDAGYDPSRQTLSMQMLSSFVLIGS